MKNIIVQAFKDAYEFMLPFALWILLGIGIALCYLTFGHVNIFEIMDFEQ